MRNWRRLALVLAIVVPAAPAPGQGPGREKVPVFGAEAKVVAVPVFVTDERGRSVPGLTATDFEVEDQGRRVELVAFEAVDATSPSPPATASPLLQAATRRQLLLLFDLAFSTPAGVLRAQEAAIDFVRTSLAPSDLAAVATFGPQGLRLLVGFTPDRAQVERAVATLGVVEPQARQRDPLGIAYDLGVPRWGPGLPSRKDDLSAHLVEEARLMARGDQAHYRTRVDGFVDGVAGLARALDAVRGRKQVILLSGGFDASVTAGAGGQESTEASEAVLAGRPWEARSDRYFGDAAARESLDGLFRALALTDTVIHTLDVGGLAAVGGADSAQPQTVTRGRETLVQLASNTGGRFVGDSNDLRAGLVEILDASRSYYVLAFEPLDPTKKPDRPRRLEVKVRREGLTVSHRRAYVLAEPKAEPSSTALRAAEAVAKGFSGGAVGLRAVGVPYRDAKGGLSLPVILQIDGRTLVGRGVPKELGLEVVGYAFDASGHVLDTVSLSPRVDRGAVAPALEARGFQVITAFAVPPGAADLRFAVWEKASGRAGSLRLRVDVPAPDAPGLVLSPPLSVDDPRARLVVPAPSRGLPALPIPFRLGEQPFTAELEPALANGEGREVCVMVWGAVGRDGAGRPYEVSAELVDASGGSRSVPLAAPPRLVPDADGVDRYVVTLAPRGVPAGPYVLRLAFADPVSHATARSEAPVRVD